MFVVSFSILTHILVEPDNTSEALEGPSSLTPQYLGQDTICKTTSLADTDMHLIKGY